jgi:hypothetical protein
MPSENRRRHVGSSRHEVALAYHEPTTPATISREPGEALMAPEGTTTVRVGDLEFRAVRIQVPAGIGEAGMRWWIVDSRGRDYIGPPAPFPLSPEQIQRVVADWWALKCAMESDGSATPIQRRSRGTT